MSDANADAVGSIPDNLLGLGVGDWFDHKRRRHIALWKRIGGT